MDKKSFNEELAAKWLGAIIYRETSKPDDEADMELVEECEAALMALSNSVSYSEEEINEKLNIIHSAEKKREILQNKSQFHSVRRTAVIAACVVLLLLGSAISAYAFIPSVQDTILRLLKLPVGVSLESEGVTFEHMGQSKIYSTLDELLSQEELDFLLPRELPKELLVSIVNVTRSDDYIHVGVAFTDSGASMGIETDTGKDYLGDMYYTAEKKEVNGVTSYISDSDGICASITVHEGYVYYISADTKDKVITIIENLFDRS